ncbi:recombinase family protein [Paraconexibacter antarcticus]|uniref:Recombinase family protein n=1 Tax=Paraconexibacter antarcticus TaxID=2949664 RepID=A0ABY5DYK5_9ACTN|nr:recombinase family protein [Paraconexibacter antarcticus]UTI65634.1 recombinase family protein [Paraconexibacter antarcticus]
MTSSGAPRSGMTISALIYCRVSTEEQGMSGFSLEHQADVCAAAAHGRGWDVRRTLRERASGKSTAHRPVLASALEDLSSGAAGALIVSRLDRLSRSTADFYMLMDRAAKEGWSLVCLEPAVDMSSPFGRAMAGMAAVFAQLERELISQRQRDSAAIRKAKGIYSNGSERRRVDEGVAREILRMRGRGMSYVKIARALEIEGYRPPRGGAWSISTVRAVISRG